MPVGFVATDFDAGLENDVWVAVLGAPSTGEDDFYLMFQNKEKYSRQDVQLGMNQPYVEFCGQGWSWYGHMKKVELQRSMIRVCMDNEAAEHMKNDGILEVQFNLPDSQFVQLQSVLQSIFGSVEYFSSKG